MILGCSYFSFKYQAFEQGSKVLAIFTSIKENNLKAFLCFSIGLLIQLVILILNKFNNNNPDASFAWNLIFLLISRPLFILGFQLTMLPLLLTPSFSPLSQLLSHKFFIPYSRLTYGVFLCNSILMEFRIFNL